MLCNLSYVPLDFQPSLYWIPKLHERPFKQRYIAGSAKFSTKPHSKLLTSHLFKWKISTDSLCNVCKVEEGYSNFFMSCKYLNMLCNSAFKLYHMYYTVVYSRETFDN
jgi:hypothetical protein